MNSAFLNVLDAKIAASAGEERVARLAERAAYLARSGQVEESRGANRRHSARAFCFRGRTSALLNLADGLCHYYKNVSPMAADRFARARAIAQVGGQSDLEGQALSWLGLVHYGAYRFDDMCRCIDECIGTINCTDSVALARTSLNISMSLHLANRFDLAMPWYRRSHLFAVELHDEAMISAMLHNMAALWLSNCRNSQLGGPKTSDQSRQALSGAISSFNFDGLVGLSALSVLTPLLEAQICSLGAEYERAVSLYDKCSEEFDVVSLHNWGTWMLADREWCQLALGRSDSPAEVFNRIYESVSAVRQADERAATLSRLAAGWSMLGFEARSRECEEQAAVCWREFSELQAYVLDRVTNSRGSSLLEQRFPL
ncbi:hypothetical protein FSC37_01195 [Piscinibacter aquaticus]|uniref:Tetratricopeptide repeat protein n=1 Tax=Piscinibacter aquaticus TaxID=392597 RepID=A0A5C6TY91_9BURK|nr:hypothetical protein FSC37_01195 [Piscinibacter aquaticus]